MRFSKDGLRLATGGADGNVRVWVYPSLKQQHCLDVNKENVDDLDFDSSGARLITVASTSTATVWRCVDGSRERTLSW